MTLLCVLLALPLAVYMALVARPRPRLLVALVLTPLWASYLVKVYAWRILLAPEGPLGGVEPGLRLVRGRRHADLPVAAVHGAAALRRPRPRCAARYLEAAADLGARPWTAFRTVVLPVLAPAVAAGSVFTFSLCLGDYITVQLVGGTSQMLGNLVYQNFSTDLPFAAAVAVLPLS